MKHLLKNRLFFVVFARMCCGSETTMLLEKHPQSTYEAIGNNDQRAFLESCLKKRLQEIIEMSDECARMEIEALIKDKACEYKNVFLKKVNALYIQSLNNAKLFITAAYILRHPLFNTILMDPKLKSSIFASAHMHQLCEDLALYSDEHLCEQVKKMIGHSDKEPDRVFWEILIRKKTVLEHAIIEKKYKTAALLAQKINVTQETLDLMMKMSISKVDKKQFFLCYDVLQKQYKLNQKKLIVE